MLIALSITPLGVGASEVVNPEACLEVARKAGSDPALVVAMDTSVALRFYTDLTPLRWDRLTPETWAAVRAHAAKRGVRIFALLKPYEVANAVERVPGNWKFLGNVRHAGIWELAP